ncbi:hypothetical protein JTB14_001707 [Gonioctena quinquepunctata]|nr:hypothetical protein JTB14_001707 [Gonioctena quinquepunctata]
MKLKHLLFYTLAVSIFCIFIERTDSKSLQNQYHSDVIVTHWPTSAPDSKKTENEENEPGFMRRQLMRFGEVASKVGNSMGAHATKISSAVDKVCEIVKTIIPLLAAICHVGQFKFCAATTEAPDQLAAALNPNSLDLNLPD